MPVVTRDLLDSYFQLHSQGSKWAGLLLFLVGRFLCASYSHLPFFSARFGFQFSVSTFLVHQVIFVFRTSPYVRKNQSSVPWHWYFYVTERPNDISNRMTDQQNFVRHDRRSKMTWTFRDWTTKDVGELFVLNSIQCTLNINV